MFNRIKLLCSLQLMFFVLLFCSQPVKAQDLPESELSAQSSNKTAQSDYVIGPGDLIDVRVFRQPELSGRYRVSEAGTLNLPFLGQMQVVGMTEAKLTDLLRENLLKILKKPQLSVTVAEFNSQMVTVIGAIKTPGRYVMRRSERLLDVIGMAGGLSDIAGQNINLVRYAPGASSQQPKTDNLVDENIKVESINLKDLLNGHPELNRQIIAGDVISVPEADTVYVTGNVNKPGAFNPKAPVTLSQAIALAGGLTAVARSNQISLFRVVPGKAERAEMTYSIGDIEKRKVKDPILEPNDVVYIRGSESRSIGLAFVRALTGGVGGGLGLALFR